MRLYYAPQSPFARKVRAAAIELGLDDHIELIYAEVVPSRVNADFAAINPLGRIPALVTGDGDVLFDSTVICEYLDALAGGGRLFPHGPRRWPVLRNHALAAGIADSVIAIRYETWLRPEALRWADVIAGHWAKVDSGLDAFEKTGDRLDAEVDIAQLMLGAAIGYIEFRWPERGWRASRPRLAAWYDAMSKRPSMARTMPANPDPR